MRWESPGRGRAERRPDRAGWRAGRIQTCVECTPMPSISAGTIPGMTDEPVPHFDEVRLAELVMPNHTNHHGTLFGGHALGLMDHAGWVAATRCARRTSVTVGVDMYAEDVASGRRRLATSGSFVFVAIDDDGNPTPIDRDAAVHPD